MIFFGEGSGWNPYQSDPENWCLQVEVSDEDTCDDNGKPTT